MFVVIVLALLALGGTAQATETPSNAVTVTAPIYRDQARNRQPRHQDLHTTQQPVYPASENRTPVKTP